MINFSPFYFALNEIYCVEKVNGKDKKEKGKFLPTHTPSGEFKYLKFLQAFFCLKNFFRTNVDLQFLLLDLSYSAC